MCRVCELCLGQHWVIRSTPLSVPPKCLPVFRLLLHVLRLWQCEVADDDNPKQYDEDAHHADDKDPPHADNPIDDRLDFIRGEEVEKSVQCTVSVDRTAAGQEVAIPNHIIT